MLVLVVALLAMIALMATTLLVMTRYDQVGVQSSAVASQMEMLLPMLEGSIRRTLTEDLWGDNAACNWDPAADDPAEGYDGPDAKHPWMTATCGKLVAWEPQAGDPADIVEYVVGGEGDWRYVPSSGPDGLQIRYAMRIQGLGGLLNANVARQPDPDMVGGDYAGVTPTIEHPEDWPYTIWAFHNQRGNGDWGYWWWTPPKIYNYNQPPKDFFAACGDQPFRGGGPAQQADLRFLLSNSGDLARLDGYLRKVENYGHWLDIQDELDLRFPNVDRCGGPYRSKIEALLPSLFTSGGELALRRRFVTAVGRTTNWQARREPIRMHPYDEAYWARVQAEYESPDWTWGTTDAKPPFDRSRCEEDWYCGIDYPNNQEMLTYCFESWMGCRMSLQRGVTLSKMAEDDPFDVYDRISTHYDVYGWQTIKPLAPAAQIPGCKMRSGGAWKWRAAQPWLYDDYLTDYPLRDSGYEYSEGPSMLVLLLGNFMATMGVPPGLDPTDPAARLDEAATFAPPPPADSAVRKSRLVRRYGELAGTLHLNLIDWQDANGIPAMLYTGSKLNRFSKYGDRAGAEDRPYLSEVVIEFELWPDYADISRRRITVGSTHPWRLYVERVDKGTSAQAAGLAAADTLLGIRKADATDATAFTDLYIASDTGAAASMAALRDFLRAGGLKPGDAVDLKVDRGGGTILRNIALRPAVRTIAVEVYNPHDHRVAMNENDPGTGGQGWPQFRYNVAVPQQYSDDGSRAFDCHSPKSFRPAPYLDGGSCMLYIETRGEGSLDQAAWMGGPGLPTWMAAHGLTAVHDEKRYYPTSHGYGNMDIPTMPAILCNLANLRPADGQLLMVINACTDLRGRHTYLADAVASRGTDLGGKPLPMPVSHIDPGPSAGIADAFDEAQRLMNAGHPYPVVRLYRPLYMESRATQFLSSWTAWNQADARGNTAASRLGVRADNEDDFDTPADPAYRNMDARGFVVTTTNKAFRFAADLSAVSRVTQPHMKYVTGTGSYSGLVDTWVNFEAAEGTAGRLAPTQIIDRQLRATLAELRDKGISSLTAQAKQMLQKAEARLRFSPYTPTTEAERAECAAMVNFLDAFTVGGAAYDNVDNNGNAMVDEHGTHKYDLGLPAAIADNSPGGGWLVEHSDCWPAYGRINLNTAPREVLEHCLLAPDDTVRRKLGEAVWTARGGEASRANADYRPFVSLPDLYERVSVYLNPSLGCGFDYYGFDGKDNHAGPDALPDLPPRRHACVDDLDERNYLWRINSELVTLHTDTFAAYLRFQARRLTDAGQWKVLAERRVYSIWDRANCIWPPKRHDGKPHPDFVPPQRIGIQVFGH